MSFVREKGEDHCTVQRSSALHAMSPNTSDSPQNESSIPLQRRNEPAIDKVFEDDDQATVFLKGLISSAGLRSSWQDMSKRLRALEDAFRDLHRSANPEALEEKFVLQQFVDSLPQFGPQIESLEKALKDTITNFESHSEKIGALRSDLEEHDRLFRDAGAERNRVEDLVRCNEKVINAQVAALQEAMEERFRDHESGFLEQQERLNTHEEHAAALSDAIDGIWRHFESEPWLPRILAELQTHLSAYVSKEDMDVERETIHVWATTEIGAPLWKDLDRHDTTLQELAFKDREIAQDVDRVWKHVIQGQEMLPKKITQVISGMGELVREARLAEVQDEIASNVKDVDGRFISFKVEFTNKVGDIIRRMCEHSEMLRDHEHVLQHHAEEMGTRASKFELVLSQQRVDRCATQERVDSEVKDLHRLLRSRATVGTSEHSTSGHGGAESPFEVSASLTEPLGPPGSSGICHLRQGGRSDHYTFLQQQLECLATGTLCLAYVALRFPVLGLSREARRNRECEMAGQLKNLMLWIAHRELPKGWDPTWLTSLAVEAGEHKSCIAKFRSATDDDVNSRKRFSLVPVLEPGERDEGFSGCDTDHSTSAASKSRETRSPRVESPETLLKKASVQIAATSTCPSTFARPTTPLAPLSLSARSSPLRIATLGDLPAGTTPRVKSGALPRPKSRAEPRLLGARPRTSSRGQRNEVKEAEGRECCVSPLPLVTIDEISSVPQVRAP